MRGGKLVLTIVGAVVALMGLGSFLAGGGLAVAYGTQRDADGFLESRTYDLTSDAYAITTEQLDLGADPGDWFPAEGDLTLRATITPDTERPVFVGVAAEDDLRAYLDGVAHEEATRVGVTRGDVTTRSYPGDAPTVPPGEVDVWVASAEGTGEQTVTWDAEPGSWVLAIMNADGSAVIDVDARAAARTELLLPLLIGLLLGGLLLLAIGAGLIVAGTVGARDGRAAVAAAGVAHPGPYPLAIRGELDPDLSRWQWLVKWFLALPHLLVLGVLWAVFSVLTVVAGFAILFTGRYPRSIFDFNVGVIRWTWRVTFYAYGVLGTDRYPPFTLQSDPDYPADLAVAYPERLSRGLVLVKWWLLAIPHYLIIGLLTGGFASWTWDLGQRDGWQASAGGGLIGVLVLVAALVLLVTGAYPRGLYDLVLGLQRWVYRVVAYVALMTDEYPPFRLDTGGSEPPPAPPTGPGAPPTGQEATRAPAGV